jgi:hypothetical protein
MRVYAMRSPFLRRLPTRGVLEDGRLSNQPVCLVSPADGVPRRVGGSGRVAAIYRHVPRAGLVGWVAPRERAMVVALVPQIPRKRTVGLVEKNVASFVATGV